MPTPDFVHLHNHSEYSLLDGACRIKDMIGWAQQQNAPAIGLTDHGNMFGILDFYKTAKKADVKPIIGCEAYIALNSRYDQDPNRRFPRAYHLILLVENQQGYKNLMKLVSLGYTEGYEYKGIFSRPRIDKELLQNYHEGLIVLTSCIHGTVPSLLLQNQPQQAFEELATLKDIMGPGHLFIEIQMHGLEEENKVMPQLLELGRKLELPLVGTNDCHYIRKEDAEVHEVLMNIQTGKTLEDEKRLSFANDQFYFKTTEEMQSALKDFPEEVITNTVAIAERCHIELDYKDYIMPQCEVPEGHDTDSYLVHLCREGLKQRYKGTVPEDANEQLEYELGIIKQTGFSGYLLIVADYVRFARKRGFPISARGSAGGSLALYALGVTSFNPMDYDLIFERFLNLERISMPDIDLDFAPEHRDLVIEYLSGKYGHDCVAHVAAFSNMKAKAVLRDVGRVLGMSPAEADRIVKLIPPVLNISLDEAIESVPGLQEMEKSEEQGRLIRLARALEGMKRHVSIHASGVVMVNDALDKHVPLFKDKNERIATQFDGDMVKDVGLVKFDFLGVKTIAEIHHTVQLIEKIHGVKIDLEEIPFDDQKTYELIGKGLLAGLFQLETSAGMRAVIMQIKPTKFEDFIPIPALYRPGPIESGMMDSFINRKLGLEEITYPHPTLENALSKTYGVCIYQEQVMQIARDMAGFTMGQADVLRKAMGDKNLNVLEQQRELFIQGAMEKGISAEDAERVFELILPFAGYAFNKAHTAAYAILSYQMAYLKAHYPVEFMATLMTSESADTDKIVIYMAECRKLGIKVLPPDINESYTDFTVSGRNIRFGLAAIKNVSSNAIDAIVKARDDGPFESLQDFCERTDPKTVNRRSIECLIKCGAFDSLGGHRAQYWEYLEDTLKQAQSTQKDKARGQTTLFSILQETVAEDISLPDVPEWSLDEVLRYEKELLGFYLSGHPLDQYCDTLEHYTTAT